MKYPTMTLSALGGRIRCACVTAPATLAISALLATLAFTPPASATGACPNETLRSELNSGALPDCRAYEQVTPVYKEGVPLTSEFALTEDGSHLIVAGLGAFASTESDELGNSQLFGAAYELSRTASGWTASSLSPPASKFNINGIFDAGADLSNSLWELGTHAQPAELSDLYLEQPRGTFTEIGPATPSPTTGNNNRYTYVGASADLSHIFYTIENPAFRWPFDSTSGQDTLYEYVGTGHSEPSLVGVSGAHGSTALESECGTRLGSSDATQEFGRPVGSMYNAISSSGQRVFFTAIACGERPAVDELFGREETSPSQSQTVAISEPDKESCATCLTGEGLSAAVFQGASEDGSKAFFTTEQELLPGAKGNNLYEYDFNASAGDRVSLVSTPISGEAHVQGITRISEDGTRIYFVAAGVLAGENAEHQQPLEGQDNLYVSERDERFPGGHLAFIATLSSDDAPLWQQEDERPAQLSHDGRFLVFTSRADLTREGTSPGPAQVFQYDDQSGRLVRASIGQDGFADDNRTPLHGAKISAGAISGYSYAHTDSPAAADGLLAPEDGTVLFQSPDALTPQALNDETVAAEALVPNIYEYRAGNVYLISDGRDTHTFAGTSSVYLLGASASGGDVFFDTADSLIPQDTDTQQDFYDARVGGGFPPSAAAPGCSGDPCQGAPSQAGALPAFGGSAAQTAGASEVPAPPSASGPPKVRTLTRAQKLARALKACRRRPRRQRRGCERQARKRYAVTARKSDRRQR